MVAPQTELELPGHTEWLKDKYWGELSGELRPHLGVLRPGGSRTQHVAPFPSLQPH